MLDSKPGDRRLRSSYLSSIVSISLVLFMLGMLGMLVLNARKISDYVKEHVQLNIFLQDDITDQEISALQDLLENNIAFKSVRYVSKQEALDSLKKDLGEDATGMLDINPLPSSFEVRIQAAYANSGAMEKIAEDIRKNAQVREVTYRQSEVENINRNFRVIAIGILIFCSLLFIIAVALINSTIRLSMYSKRFLIKSMQLVGATRNFIRRPFLARALMHGFYAGIIACSLLAGILYLIYSRFPGFVLLRDIREDGILFAGVLVFGILLSLISTYFAVNRFLRLKLEELYG